MKTKMVIDTQTIIRFWLVPLGIVLAGAAIYSARTALVIIGAAIFLALALNGPVSWLAKHLPGKSRVAGTTISFITVVLLIGSFVTLVVPPILQQTAKFATTVPAIIDGATRQYDGVSQLIERYQLQSQVDEALESVKDNAAKWAANIGGNVVGSLSSFGGFIVSLIIALVLAFLMLIEGPKLLTKIWRLYDDEHKMQYHRHLLQRMYHVVNGYVVGQITIAAIGATVIGVFVFILSFLSQTPGNLAIPSAAIYFVLCLIPVFGSTIAAILIGALIVLNDPIAAIIFVIGFIVYQQIENNIVGPTVQSKKMELTALWILLAVTVGVYIFGVVGAIISIPIAGCLKVLFDEYLKYVNIRRASQKQATVKLASKSKA